MYLVANVDVQNVQWLNLRVGNSEEVPSIFHNQ